MPMMPPSEPPQQKMVIKSPSKPTLLGLTRTKASKAQLGSEPNGLSKSIGRTEAIKQQLFGGTGEGNGSLARKEAVGLSRTKSRVQLAPPDVKETGRPETSVSRVKSRVQVMEVNIMEGRPPVNGMSRAKSKIHLLKKHMDNPPMETMSTTNGLSKAKSKIQLVKNHEDNHASARETPSMSKAKSKTQLQPKKEVQKKTLVKFKSRAVLKDKNDPVSMITDDVVDKLNKKEKDPSLSASIDTAEDSDESLDETVTAVALDHCYSSPSPPSLEIQDRVLGRIAFSDVSVFYFDRTALGCSVPRTGAHTLGMAEHHSHYERRRLGEEEEDSPHVRRKLFSIQSASDLQLQDEERGEEEQSEEKKEEEKVKDVDWAQRPLPQALKKTPTTRLSTSSRVVYNNYRNVENNSDSDSDEAITFTCTPGPEPTPNSRATSAAFKRSLSQSRDLLATRERKDSISHCLPVKAPKPEDETPTTTTKETEQKVLMKTRSSSRINRNKSITALSNLNVNDKPKSMLTPKSLKSSKSLSRAFTTIDLKVQSSKDETSSESLPKPNRKLVSSITTSCLKSFQTYHVSPESKEAASKNYDDEDLPVPRPKFERSHSKKFQKSPPEEVPTERGSSAGKKKSKKKGACGTRGLTPLAERGRVSLLRSHGVQDLQTRAQLEELTSLRESREKCGCSCVGDCKPETCECAMEGIECQVERSGFPCSCGPGCANPQGRREFDETEVSLHYINTMMTQRGVMDLRGSSQESLSNPVDIGTF